MFKNDKIRETGLLTIFPCTIGLTANQSLQVCNIMLHALQDVHPLLPTI